MLRRLARRLLGPAAPAAVPPAQPPPRPVAVATAVPHEPHPPGPLPVREGAARRSGATVEGADVDAILAAVQPRGRPVLVHHWASWDGPSTAGLPTLRALVEARGLDAVGIAWDTFVEAPVGRIPGMAQRPARWAEGEQAAAWAREAGLSWPTLVCEADPDALFAALGLVDRFVPQVTLYGADGGVHAHHGGPLAGARWAAFVARVGAA